MSVSRYKTPGLANSSPQPLCTFPGSGTWRLICCLVICSSLYCTHPGKKPSLGSAGKSGVSKGHLFGWLNPFRCCLLGTFHPVPPISFSSSSSVVYVGHQIRCRSGFTAVLLEYPSLLKFTLFLYRSRLARSYSFYSRPMSVSSPNLNCTFTFGRTLSVSFQPEEVHNSTCTRILYFFKWISGEVKSYFPVQSYRNSFHFYESVGGRFANAGRAY